MRVISHYTVGTPYELEVNRLEASLRGLRIEPYELVPTEDTGTWLGNCALKPGVLIDRLADGESLLYVDADAELLRDPRPELEKLMVDHDLGVHYFRDVQVASGTLVFNGTPTSSRLLTAWRTVCEGNPDLPDQECLAMAIALVPDCRVLRLPSEYCFIFDLSVESYPGVEPVIRHHQASRRYRK